MTFPNILVFAAVCLAAGGIPRVRTWLLFLASVLAVFWLQPALPVRNLDFWLPMASIGLATAIWIVTARKRAPAAETASPAGSGGSRMTREDWIALSVLGLTISALALTRYLDLNPFLTTTRPPEFLWVLAGLAIGILLLGGLWIFSPRRGLALAGILFLLALFVILKSNPLTQAAAALLRRFTGQAADLASPLDIRWLGFSYIAFRLIHALRDRMTGRLPDCSLREFITYGIFFPAVTAGPIDRVERFVKDLRAIPGGLSGTFVPGGERVLIGVFKKFVLADGLAILALNATVASRVTAPHWMWLFLYAYAFRIYFDFSGYTDIALGLGRWAGIALPENFHRPYLQPNLTVFWNSWHITLAQWFRSYFFNPLTRALRSDRRALPIGLIILLGQLATMTLIGLWHGVTWNFLIWGCWHGMGLFLHNRWGEWSRGWMPRLEKKPLLKRVYTAASTLATFHFVALGWVWFALPTVGSSTAVFLRLFGISG
jgi:alginate O-acetyltransferase complex protein AlgI